MKQLKELLQEHLDKVGLLDAQSFLWMMHFVSDKTQEFDPDDIEECETKVVKGYAEGHQTTQYYVKKYERDPRNRAAAIKIHAISAWPAVLILKGFMAGSWDGISSKFIMLSRFHQETRR